MRPQPPPALRGRLCRFPWGTKDEPSRAAAERGPALLGEARLPPPSCGDERDHQFDGCFGVELLGLGQRSPGAEVERVSDRCGDPGADHRASSEAFSRLIVTYPGIVDKQL